MNQQMAAVQAHAQKQINDSIGCYGTGGVIGPPVGYRPSLDAVLQELAQERALSGERLDLGIPEPKGTAERVASLRVKAKLLHQEEQRVELEQARRLVEELRGRQEKLDEAQKRVKELEDSLKVP